MRQNDNIDALLEMLDHPEDYSEEQIWAIVNADDECRTLYHQMVQARCSYRREYARATPTLTVAEAWQRFEQAHGEGRGKLGYSWLRIAAIVVGAILMTGLGYAAITRLMHPNKPRLENTISTPNGKMERSASTIDSGGSDSGRAAAPPNEVLSDTIVTFDNATLAEIVSRIGSYYGCEVVLCTTEASTLRLYFAWHPQAPIEDVVRVLNLFEKVDITLDHQTLIVQ